MQAPPSGIEQMCAEQQQLRVDPADGKAYTSVSFLECYGEHEVQRRWATALPLSLESSFLPVARSVTLHVAPYCLSRCHATLSLLVCVGVQGQAYRLARPEDAHFVCC